MPATRLRNLDWQRSLRQVYERGGSLDVAIATDSCNETEAGANILWRVRLLGVTDDAMVIEHPTTLGRQIDLAPNVELVAILTIGQNRWMFRSRNVGSLRLTEGGGRYGSKPVAAMRLSMPEIVERCQRRSNYRVNTVSLNLPLVEMWPLLDPKTVIVAERSNELMFEQTSAFATTAPPKPAMGDDLTMPDVGPRFSARLVNLGGGGVGLSVAAADSQPLLRHKIFWLRVALPPALEAPICATAKVVHTHMTAAQDYYAGMAFDFTFNPAHQRCVVEQIGRYVAGVQRAQMLRKTG